MTVPFQVDQSVFTVLPSKSSLRPGMILVFELFLLRGAVVSTDRVVGWGCFPISDGEFNVVEGKYVQTTKSCILLILHICFIIKP